MVVKTTGVVNYDLTREYLVGTNSGTENNVSQTGNTVCPKRDIQYTTSSYLLSLLLSSPKKSYYNYKWRKVNLRVNKSSKTKPVLMLSY